MPVTRSADGRFINARSVKVAKFVSKEKIECKNSADVKTATTATLFVVLQRFDIQTQNFFQQNPTKAFVITLYNVSSTQEGFCKASVSERSG